MQLADGLPIQNMEPQVSHNLIYMKIVFLFSLITLLDYWTIIFNSILTGQKAWMCW